MIHDNDDDKEYTTSTDDVQLLYHIYTNNMELKSYFSLASNFPYKRMFICVVANTRTRYSFARTK